MEQQSGDDGGEAEHEPPEGTGLPTAVASDLPGELCRQHALDYLSRTGVASLGELAERIAARNAEHHGDVERIAVALHHVHLPKLAAIGLVDYDPGDRIVEARPELAHADPYLSPTRSR